MPLLNIFFQVFFLQQILFGLNLVSSSQVVGQHEPDVENKGMSWCSEWRNVLEGFVTFESWIMYTKFCYLFSEINILGDTSPFLTYDRSFVRFIVYTVVNRRDTKVVKSIFVRPV